MTKYDDLIDRAHDFRAGCSGDYLELQMADAIEELQEQLEDLQKWAVWAEQACSWGTNPATVTGSVLHKILKGEEHGEPWNTRKHA